MKKRITAGLLALVLGLALCACGEKEPPATAAPTPAPTPAPAPAAAPFDAEEAARALLDSGAYTDTEDMEPPLEAELFFDLLDAGTVTGGAVYSSTYLAELAAVVSFTDEAAAQAGMAVLEDWVTGRIAAERDYRPAEVPKLQNAILVRIGATAVLAVTGDNAKARAVIDTWGK